MQVSIPRQIRFSERVLWHKDGRSYAAAVEKPPLLNASYAPFVNYEDLHF